MKEGNERRGIAPHRDWHGAHVGWIYRPHAFRWDGRELVGINFIPYAGELRAWLQQQGQLHVVSAGEYQREGRYTNPFTYSGGALTLMLADSVNDFHDFCTQPSADNDPVEAEVKRLRLYGELVLYCARICEVVVKQLLYCSSVPESRYKSKSLGGLLDTPCIACKKENGKEPHSVSLLGTLAHPFHLCLEFEHCAMDHMFLVNKLRNSQAAHSEIQSLNPRTSEASKAELLEAGSQVLDGFVHMLTHLEKLENQMLDDLAAKGEVIEHLRAEGLPEEKTDFRLVPGVPFVYRSPGGSPTKVHGWPWMLGRAGSSGTLT